MQSHASRHVVSEFLKDRHPDLSEPFPKGIISEEIAEAYGRRAIPKLVDVLALQDLPDTDRAHCLRIFLSLLSSQEHKTAAINDGAGYPLRDLINGSLDYEVRSLSCQAMASLATIMPGRESIVAVGGLKALTDALTTTSEAAAGALREVALSLDGAALVARADALDSVVCALVDLLRAPLEDGSTFKACNNACATLAGLTRTDAGVVASLEPHLPQCLVALSERALEGDFRFEPDLMDLMEQIATVLQQLCHHPYGKTAAREAEAYKPLAAMLELHHAGTQLHASSALMGLAVEKEAKVHVMYHAGRELVRLLRGDDPILAANARDALCASAEHLEARRTLEMMLSPEERRMLLWRGPEPDAPPDYRFQIESPAALAAMHAARAR